MGTYGKQTPLKVMDLKPGDEAHMMARRPDERYRRWQTARLVKFTPTLAVFDNGARFYLEIERNGYSKGDQRGERGCSVWPLNHPDVLADIRADEIEKAKHDALDRARTLISNLVGYRIANQVKTLDDVARVIDGIAARLAEIRQETDGALATLATLTDEEKAQAGQ